MKYNKKQMKLVDDIVDLAKKLRKVRRARKLNHIVDVNKKVK